MDGRWDASRSFSMTRSGVVFKGRDMILPARFLSLGTLAPGMDGLGMGCASWDVIGAEMFLFSWDAVLRRGAFGMPRSGVVFETGCSASLSTGLRILTSSIGADPTCFFY